MSQPWDYIAKVVNIGDSGCGKTSVRVPTTPVSKANSPANLLLAQLTIRLCEGRFQPDYNVTIGVEFGSRIIPLPPPAPNSPAPRIKLQIWDTAGQETFRSITRSYFRGCAGAIIVYDVTRRTTFLSARMWLDDLKKAEGEGYAGDSGGGAGEGGGVSVILVGNKKDLVEDEGTEESEGGGGGAGAEGSGPSSPDPQPKKRRREVTKEEARKWAENHGIEYFVETSAKSGEGVEEAFVKLAEDIYQRIKAGRVAVGSKGSGVRGPAGRKGIDDVVTFGGGGGIMGGCC